MIDVRLNHGWLLILHRKVDYLGSLWRVRVGRVLLLTLGALSNVAHIEGLS